MSTHQRDIAQPLPVSLSGRRKTDMRSQFAALCYRRKKGGKIEVLLITSRATKRWIIPKGWPIDGKSPVESAVTEAWEEAGVLGESDGRCIGIFSYSKDAGGEGALPCLAMVFALEVQKEFKQFPEAGQRRRVWVSRKKAAKMVEEPELSRILKDFDPGQLS